jgi:hypothetical protein
MFSALVGRSVDTKALIGPIPSSEEVLKRTLHLTARLDHACTALRRVLEP